MYLHAVLHKIQNAGITLNNDKCYLSKSEVHFIVNIISAYGIKPDLSRGHTETSATHKCQQGAKQGEKLNLDLLSMLRH